jgi:hypothetical protein
LRTLPQVWAVSRCDGRRRIAALPPHRRTDKPWPERNSGAPSKRCLEKEDQTHDDKAEEDEDSQDAEREDDCDRV